MSAANMETVTNAVQLVGGQVAKVAGGPIGQAAASLLLGEPGLATSMVDLLAKIENKTATPNDVADVLQDIAAILAGVAVLTGSSPVLLTAVGVAGAINFISKIFPLSDAVSGITDEIIDARIRDALNPYPPHPVIDVSQLDPKTLLPRPNAQDVNGRWNSARAPASRDPLAIDLDGDGIETVGLTATGTPILFDHDADGSRTGTGWLKPDDGWLVRNLNGNGAIDSGRELFGVDTVIVSTDFLDATHSVTRERNAYSGFDALRVLDTGAAGNGSAGFADGVIDSQDAAFAELKVWRDLNQDGVSQSGELMSLGAAGIASISIQSSFSDTQLGNGNSITVTATVVRTSGAQTQVAGVGLAGDSSANNLNLADNPFYRTFTDSIPLTEAAKALPEMGGSGWVRDLREAMSLGAGTELASTVQQFAAADNRTAQLALIDELLGTWAGSAGFSSFLRTHVGEGKANKPIAWGGPLTNGKRSSSRA